MWANDKIRLAVSQVQVGGRNLLKGTKPMEFSLYSFDSSGAAAMGSYEAYEGGLHVINRQSNLRVWLNGALASYVRHENSSMLLKVSPGESVTVSFKYAMLSGDSPVQIQANWYRGVDDHSPGYSDSDPTAPADPNRFPQTMTMVDGGWGWVQATFTVPDYCTMAGFAFRSGRDFELYDCEYLVREFKLEKGTKATDWSPAPEDTDGAIEELSAQLTVQAGAIAANATKIETVGQSAASAQNAANAAQGTANGAVERVVKAEQTVSALDEQVKTKVSAEEFNALGNRVSAAEGSITTQAGLIEAKVEKTAFDALGNIVSQQATKIEQTDEQVLILAGRTVGGTNLLRGTGTLRTANYAIDSSGASAMGSCTEDEFGGFRIVCNNANVRWWPGDQMISPGQSYAMSIQYRMNSGSAPVQFQYVLKSADGADLYFWDSVNHSQGGSRTEDGWTVLTSVITIPNDARIAKMALAVRTGWDGMLYTCDYNIRRPKFETGSMATDWSPNPEDPAASVNAGGVVRVDQSGVHMSGGTIEMETSDGVEYIHIKNSGIAASSLDAPNVTPRYDGPGTVWINPNAETVNDSVYRSLNDLFARLRGRVLDMGGLTVHMQGNDYGVITLQRVFGGAITIHGNGVTLNGGLAVEDCTSRVYINNINVVANGVNRAAWVFGRAAWVQWHGCTFNGNGAGYGLFLGEGGSGMVWDCGFYNATNLLYVGHASDASVLGMHGGNCTYFAATDGCTIKFSGSRADGAWAKHNTALVAPADPSSLTINYGSAQPSVPAIQTASWNYLNTDSYAGKWGRPSGDAAQGVIQTDNSGNIAAIYGTIWFDAAAIRNALGGKTINQASLRLHALVGYGRGVEVSVQLHGTNQAYDGRSGQPELTTSYGTIASIKPGNTAEITIPVAAIADIVSGRIQALVLKSDDTALREGKTYSTNYARFAGSTSATAETCPRLTVVYQ